MRQVNGVNVPGHLISVCKQCDNERYFFSNENWTMNDVYLYVIPWKSHMHAYCRLKPPHGPTFRGSDRSSSENIVSRSLGWISTWKPRFKHKNNQFILIAANKVRNYRELLQNRNKKKTINTYSYIETINKLIIKAAYKRKWPFCVYPK